MSINLGTPNLFILGAAKSGTTSLYNILSRHPCVQVTKIKEPSFFCSYFQDISNPIIYLSLFNDTYDWRVDASHVYLTNPESPKAIYKLFPDARFIIILRDPVKRSYALYRHMRRHSHADGRPYEPIADFTEALKTENDRYHSDNFWTECRQYPWNFFYVRSSLYDEQIKRYLDLFEKEQILVVSLSQLSSNPHKFWDNISRFLGLDSSPFMDLNEWHFNADKTPDDMPLDAQNFLSERLNGVQMRVEDLLGTTLDFSM